MTRTGKIARLPREIFGLAPKTPELAEETAPTAPGSNPVKVNPTQSNQIKPDKPSHCRIVAGKNRARCAEEPTTKRVVFFY